ncbi:MAG: ATP-binding protein [Pseudomonadota bacterium]
MATPVKIAREGDTGTWLMVAVFAAVLLSLYLLGNSADNMERFGRVNDYLLVIDALLTLVVFWMVAVNAWRLFGDLRSGVAGSRLTVRLVILLTLTALIPVTIIYVFSVRFLRSGIDSWFNVQVEQALDSALVLSRESVGDEIREIQRRANQIASRLADLESDVLVPAMSGALGAFNARELNLRGRQGELEVSVSDGFGFPTNSLAAPVVAQVLSGETLVEIEEHEQDGLSIRVLTPLSDNRQLRSAFLLEARFALDERRRQLGEEVQSTFQRYQQLTFMREPLKFSFVATLSLILALSVLAAIWIAFRLARSLMRPVHNLAEGTLAVSQGDFSQRLPPGGRDELGFLVNSFNQMVSQLQSARDQADSSQAEVEQQRAYLQAVVGRISTGVLTLDDQARPRTINDAGAAMLGQDPDEIIGMTMRDAVSGSGAYASLARVALPHLAVGEPTWQENVDLPTARGTRTLVCRGAKMDVAGGGHVLVVDDISPIVRAERDAAWSEVARRLAHEIKNPLTPIQLSAERLRHRYLETLGDDARVLDRATRTIVEQVESMKSMVKAFAEYADTPALQFTDVDLSVLLGDVVELYRGLPSGRDIKLSCADGLPAINGDEGRLRQLLHNLVKNALEAQEGQPFARVDIWLESTDAGRSVELRIRDRGPGFDLGRIDRIFEPYVTGKVRGTGLGLAIVKQIVTEHDGDIDLGNAEGGGAVITVRFPVLAG